MADQGYHIIITDRNPNVRDLLRREMAAAGHAVQVAGTGRQLIRKLHMDISINLVIVDPDLPDTDPPTLSNLLARRFPAMPVIFHAFAFDDMGRFPFCHPAVFVEKSAASIERLKLAVTDLLRDHRPFSRAHPEEIVAG